MKSLQTLTLNYTEVDYENYNWYNDDLNDEKISNINLKLSYKELLVLTADYNEIDNYTFFRESTKCINPRNRFKKISSCQSSQKIKLII